MKWLLLFNLATFATIGETQVIDFGDPSQYANRIKSPPSLSGNQVWLSGSGDKGVNVIFSESVQSRISSILGSCGSDSSKCVSDIYNTLDRSGVEFESRLNRRAFRHMITKGARKNQAAAFFVIVSTFLYSNWKEKWSEAPKVGFYLPANIATSAAPVLDGIQTQAVTLSAAGSAIASITLPPVIPATPTGSMAPQVTTMNDDKDGLKKGDLVAVMDDGFAQKLADFIGMSGDCEDGRNFDAQHPKSKRVEGTLGHAICGAERIISNAGKDAPFGDLTLLQYDQESLVLKENVGNFADAVMVIRDYVFDYAPLIGLPDEVVEQVGLYVAAFAMSYVIDGVKIGAKTVLNSNVWSAKNDQSRPSPSPSSKAGCPDPTATPLFCGYEDGNDCTAKFAPGNNLQQKVLQEVMCKDGEHQNCPCSTPTDQNVYTIADGMLAGLDAVFELLRKAKHGEKDPQCSEDTSIVQLNYWRTLYPKFCEEVKKNSKQNLSKKYSNDEIKPQRRSYPLGKRTPPPNADNYKEVEFGFEWTGGDCAKSCEDTYYDLAQGACGGYSNMMKSSGSKDLGCGKYSYSIKNRKAKVVCRDKSLAAPRGSKESGSDPNLDTAIVQFCTNNDSKVVKKGENVYQRYGIRAWGVSDRNSFWLRSAITCGEEGKMNKEDCIKALQSGMEKCAPNSGYSHGLTASVGCIDYSIDVSGVTADQSPPWDQKTVFPPPEDAERPIGGPYEVECASKSMPDKALIRSEIDLSADIEAFCGTGQKIAGLGTTPYNLEGMYKVPNPKPTFFIGALLNGEKNGVINTEASWKPYKDMQWCNGYDWILNKNDCMFALRKMHKMCSNDKTSSSADFTYRCVRYVYLYGDGR